MTDFRNKKVAILGFGLDSQDVVPYLLSKGAEVTVFDQKGTFPEQANFPQLNWQLGKKDFPPLKNFDLIVRSPGVYRYRPEILAAREAGVEISSKTKLFFDYCPGKIIGVTGTKGKGTTATLIYEILKAAGFDVYLGGNIGTGVFDLKLTSNSIVVLELSSFQLIDLEKSPQIAVVLMVTSEHLDWHKDNQEYLDAKKNIVSHQSQEDFAVINKDYPNSVEIARSATGQVIWVSKGALKSLRDDEIGLRGEHNRENVVAAATVAKLMGVSEVTIRQVIKEFKGLPNRLEEVGKIDGVTYINDSFSTTPETAVAAIKSFSEPEVIILGGSSKNSDFTELVKTIQEAKNIRTVVLIGVEGTRLKTLLKGIKTVEGGKTMSEIVEVCRRSAKPGDVVLLSPACASFDMFKNYKDRANQFKEAVKKLGKKA